ncbi:MAG: PIG-L family deacetylase [Spirochaeta sp.]|jgi:glucosamine-6-phosphate deaminase|nr:PIG-L family deacetylase [Spirochaeta sp.]
MRHVVHPRTAEVESEAARLLASVISRRAGENRQCRMGLSADPAWEGVWQELIRFHGEEGLSFSHVVLYSLDEFYPISDTDLQSHSRHIRDGLVAHLDIPASQVHLLDGTVSRETVDDYCRHYEREIAEGGGLDVALPGISSAGHIGFNGPGSGMDSPTRTVNIDRSRRISLAADFFGTENVPRQALTVGLATILSAGKIVIVQLGEDRAALVARMIEGDRDPSVPATYIRRHPDTTIITDESACGELTRYRTPWKEGPISWTDRITRRAVKMLALSTEKAILKLTEEDYNEGGLQDLLSSGGSAYDINIRVFRRFQSTITGWPGGKPDDPTGFFPKRVVVFSPHPDDDVISMGGTLIRLADQGHEVHIAYQTSGNIAVFDEDALRYTDFVRDFCEQFQVKSDRVVEIDSHVDRFLRNKQPAEVDSRYVLDIKGMIRRNEARAAARCCGVPESRLHFQDLPFYQTGTIEKRSISEQDISETERLLRGLKPHQIYAAGDLSDPHGTHRTCLSIVLQAVQRCADTEWYRQCTVWLYRGAWQEWPIDEIEMAVPLSPQEVERKRVAIFKHESQKDRALFPGSDSREFWQRSEARTRETARLYDRLGLAEYEAIEGFVEWDGESGLTI